MLAPNANAASCRNFVREAQIAFAKEVILLRRYELEAADRLRGLDSRPFDFMRDEAKKAAATIADPDRLKEEETLQRCRNATKPIRRICAGSAQLLVDILEKYVVLEKNPASAKSDHAKSDQDKSDQDKSDHDKPDYDKPQYAAAMAECETLLGLKPLETRIRASE